MNMSKEIILKKETLNMVCDAIELEINRRSEKAGEHDDINEAVNKGINETVRLTTKAYKEMLLKVLFGMEGEEENGK